MQSLIYFLLIAGLFVVMMRFGCGSHVMGHGHGHRRRGDSSHAPGTDRGSAPAQDKDPVCGMTVETASAKSSLYDGRAYYFCSNDCRDKFEAAPQRYASKGEGPSQSKEIEHGAHH